MEIREAIKYFKETTKDGFCIMGKECIQCNAELLALEALKEKLEREENKPLTLEQLKNMEK